MHLIQIRNKNHTKTPFEKSNTKEFDELKALFEWSYNEDFTFLPLGSKSRRVLLSFLRMDVCITLYRPHFLMDLDQTLQD